MLREDDLVNETLEGYRITAELISHSFSSTYLGESITPTDNHQHVVIELLYGARAHTTQAQESVQQKLSSLQQIHHPHILPVLAAGIHKEVPYVVTEYLPLRSLYDRLQRQSVGKPMEMKDAFLILARVGQALQYMHAHAIIHGCLRPQDVLFTIRDEALVTGFHRGVLLEDDLLEESNSPEVSIYRAPEQLLGQTNEQSDQYALGCLAYVLFTGYQAFTVPSMKTPGAYYKTRSLITPRRLHSTLPIYIEEAILKAMAKEPEQRYPTIAAFLEALGGPLSIENSELRETVTLLAQLMEEKQSNPAMPVTPLPGIDALETIKMPITFDLVTAKKAVAGTFDNIALPEAEQDARGTSMTFPDALLLPLAAGPADDGLNSAKFHLTGMKSDGRPSFHEIRKNFASGPQRAFALMIFLVVIVIISVTMLVNFSFSRPLKEPVASSAQGTATGAIQAQTTVPTPTIATSHGLSPYGITISSVSAPPEQNKGGTSPKSKPTTVPVKGPPSPPKSTSTPTPIPPAQVLVSLAQFYNNKGIGEMPGQANFDGWGYSYPASQLPSTGQITLQGVPYQFPGNGQGGNDNVIASGQPISFTAGRYRQAYFLAASSWGPRSGTIVVQYSDGSTSTQNITVSDWYAGAGVLNTTYRYNSRGRDGHGVAIYAIPISLDAGRLATAMILPDQQTGPYRNGRLHVFAITLLS